MADPITLLTVGATVASAATSAMGTISSANAGVAAAKSEQAQLKQVAAEKLAVATRDVIEKDREAKLLQSSLRATAANSGGGVGDSTVVGLMSGIDSRAGYQKNAIYGQARESANMDLFQGRVGVANAKAARTASYFDAGATLLSGAASVAGMPSVGASADTAFYKYGLSKKHPVYGGSMS